jgi:hypothetical protein
MHLPQLHPKLKGDDIIQRIASDDDRAENLTASLPNIKSFVIYFRVTKLVNK